MKKKTEGKNLVLLLLSRKSGLGILKLGLNERNPAQEYSSLNLRKGLLELDLNYVKKIHVEHISALYDKYCIFLLGTSKDHVDMQRTVFILSSS
jgi:hypothetical protein